MKESWGIMVVGGKIMVTAHAIFRSESHSPDTPNLVLVCYILPTQNFHYTSLVFYRFL